MPNNCRTDGCRAELPNKLRKYCDPCREARTRARWLADYHKRDKARMAAYARASRARARERRDQG